MDDPILFIARLIRPHLSGVCFGITTVALMLAGPSINGFISTITRKLHWSARYLVFVLMCTIGYGALTQILYRGLKHWLTPQHAFALVVFTAIIYLLLAYIAHKQKHI
jgi:putative Mn2+ efflux pump MntP